MGSLTKRVLVAAIAIPILLFLVFWERILPFKILAAVGLGLGLLEYLQLAKARNLKPLRTEGLVALGFALLPWVLRPLVPWQGQGALVLALLILTFAFMWSDRPLKDMIVSVSVTFFGVVYFAVFGSYFFRLREMPEGAWYLLWLFVGTWAYDTGGFFIGTRWGKHRLAPSVSPNKSWEGCAGGVGLTLIAYLLLWKFADFYSRCFSLVDVLCLTLLLSFFGQAGDLVESVIKRSLKAKDSGSLLPGHGGIFDRIDSLLFNAPILFYYLMLFKK